MTDPRIIPDEVLAEIGRSVIEHCPRCQCVTVKRLIGHGKALAEQVATLEDAFMLATKSAERRKARADAAVQRLADRDKAIRDLLAENSDPEFHVRSQSLTPLEHDFSQYACVPIEDLRALLTGDANDSE